MNPLQSSSRWALLALAITLAGCAAQRMHDDGLKRIGAG
ncbi:MAG: hypothetical protein RLZ51_1163, partial [Pseudomonadota bacterium]